MRKSAKEKIEIARITLERCLVVMKNEKGMLFEIIKHKATILFNCIGKISEYLTARTKQLTVNKNSLKNIKILAKDSLMMKSKDALNESHEFPSDEEEDKYDSIDLRNSKPDESSISVDNKYSNGIHHNQNPFIKNFNNEYFRTSEDPNVDVRGHLLCID